jgi:hypothetical protein
MDYTLISVIALIVSILGIATSLASGVLTKKTQERDNQRIEAENKKLGK